MQMHRSSPALDCKTGGAFRKTDLSIKLKAYCCASYQSANIGCPTVDLRRNAVTVSIWSWKVPSGTVGWWCCPAKETASIRPAANMDFTLCLCSFENHAFQWKVETVSTIDSLIGICWNLFGFNQSERRKLFLWTNHISYGNKMHDFRSTKILVSKK